MAGAGDGSQYLYCRADHSQHPAVRVLLRQYLLLHGAQGLGRRRVACEYHEVASAGEQFLHRFAGEVEYYVETAVAVWRPRVVAQIQVFIFGKTFPYLFQYRKPSVTGVEHSDFAGLLLRHTHCLCVFVCLSAAV